MRKASAFAAFIGALLIALGPAAAQEDLLDFGDAPEKEEPETPPEPEPAPEPEPEPDEPAVDEPAIDEPGIDEPGIDEPAVDEPGVDRSEPDTEERVSSADSPARLDKIKAVPRKAVLKRGRLELAPFASLSMNDAFYQHLALGGSLVYYPQDSFGIGIGVDYLYANIETSNVDAVRQGLTSVPGQFEQPQLFAHLDFYWVPIYGKVSLFDSSILHFEFYGTGGLGIASALDDDIQPAVNFGLGQRMFLSDWFALRVEARDHVYLTNQTVNRVQRSDVQSIVMFYIGASFFIPPSFEYSFL
ncbi:MAG: outer membrane beta-barrel domain-containing protein [Myxococcota bacterium]